MAFTMTLPSNSSMSVFPDNTLTTYNTLLAEYVSSAIPLECALQEITCPTTWYNVEKEALLVIEGEKHSSQTMPIKRLQHMMQRRYDEFFPRGHKNNEPTLTREHNPQHHPAVIKCLQNGLKVTRVQHAEPTPAYTILPSAAPSTGVATYTAETPSGGTAANEAAEEEEKEEGSVSFAVAAVRAINSLPPSTNTTSIDYTERGEYDTTTRHAPIEMSEDELRHVKIALNLKTLDKLVSMLSFRQTREYRAYTVGGAYLSNNSDLISYLNKNLNSNYPELVKRLRAHHRNNKVSIFSYNRYSLKCIIALPPNVMLQLPENLGWQLGFSGGRFLVNKTQSEYVVDLNFRAQTIYVYSDIVKHSVVGDKRAPLLRVVNVNPLLGDTQTVSFQPLIYQPVSKTSFRQIAVYLRDNTGRPIPFERGAVNVVLAFRPISNNI